MPADWLRLARIPSWLTLTLIGIEDGIAIRRGGARRVGHPARFGLDSGIEAMASIVVIWRFTGTRLASATSDRRGAIVKALKPTRQSVPTGGANMPRLPDPDHDERSVLIGIFDALAPGSDAALRSATPQPRRQPQPAVSAHTH